MQPVARELVRLLDRLADAGQKRDDPMSVQDHFEAVELSLIDSALGQHHDVDTARLSTGGDEHPIQQVKVEPLGRRELEEPVRVLAQPLHGPSTGRKSVALTFSG
jgi:hypothetical protein